MTAENSLTTGRAAPVLGRRDNGGSPIGGRVRRGTLNTIRWVAILGQLAALFFTHFGLGYQLPLGWAFCAVATSALVNLWASRRGRASSRLSDREAALYLGFDLIELAALLYLTGGLNNPFAMLILAPVTVSAATLSRATTAMLAVLAVVAVVVLSLWHLPLPWPTPGFSLEPVFILGLAAALSLSTLFVAIYVFSVAEEARRMSHALSATQMALDREQQVSALGALAAAAAHELGSPLSTIAVVAKELARDLPPDSPFKDDVQLLLSQSERCRAILASLAAKPEVGGGTPFDSVGVRQLVEMTAAPHRRHDVDLSIQELVLNADGSTLAPKVPRRPEILHGLGTLLQNAIEFARSQVEVKALWRDGQLAMTITDDGPGFPPDLLGHLGEPYLSGGDQGRGGEHMGLGIFIAETLLARTGAKVSLANRREGGAQVTIEWPQGPLADTD
jgi:two-component system, sensor histidine kinase RegB